MGRQFDSHLHRGAARFVAKAEAKEETEKQGEQKKNKKEKEKAAGVRRTSHEMDWAERGSLLFS
eukprot:3214137-Rhodomonas_salina.2